MPLAKREKQLHLVPFTPRQNEWRSIKDTSGVSAVTYSAGGYPHNAQGLGNAWTISVGSGSFSGLKQTYTSGVAWHFLGCVCAFRVWSRNLNLDNGPVPFDCKIDGRVYEGRDLRARWEDNSVKSQGDGMVTVIVDDEVPPRPDGRPHTLEILLYGDRNESAPTRTMIVFGGSGDKITGGYREQPRIATRPVGPQHTPSEALPMLGLTPANGAEEGIIRALSLITYRNVLSVPVALQLLDGGVPWLTAPTEDGYVPSQSAVALEFDPPITNIGLFTHAVAMPTTTLAAEISTTDLSSPKIKLTNIAAFGLPAKDPITESGTINLSILINNELIFATYSGSGNELTMTARGQFYVNHTTAPGVTHPNGATVTLQSPGLYHACYGF